MNSSNPLPSLRLDRLQLTNFRCFAELIIDLHPQLTVIVANNGQGKTAVLDAAASMLGSFASVFDDGADRGLRADDIRMLSADDDNRMEYADGGATVDAWGQINGIQTQWRRQIRGPKARTSRKDAKPVVDWALALQSSVRRELSEHSASVELPLVAYYPTDRLWNIRRLPYRKIPRTSRTVGYTHCLESGSDFHLMADWFRYWGVNALERRLASLQRGEELAPNVFESSIHAVISSINTCLAPTGWRDVRFDIARQEIVAKHPIHGALPVGMLSDGIRAILTLTADIAFRAAKLNPQHGDQAALLTEGVVLIDEIDMHLHPSWQQQVVPALTKAFPRIQFIVTTHSPQVLSTVDADSIRMLQPVGHVSTSRGLYSAATPTVQVEGMGSSSAMAHVMDVNPVPSTRSADKLSRYRALIEQRMHLTSEALTLRAWLEQHYGPRHTALVECDQLIKISDFRARVAESRDPTPPRKPER